MKAILIFSLICFTFSIWGPAEKAARPGIPCESREIEAESLSDCVDRYLYDSEKKKYFDRCCFVRGQFYGRQEKVCAALTEEEYLDIVETKKKKEKEADDALKDILASIEKSTEGYYTKLYQLDCSSSFIKFFSIATIFLALIF